ncbi:hypothetical protein GCM10022419_045410 [Nonomuraea rosea]|uniref:RNA polymerase sigma factor 70 region 4 type 2 domain-containing protein n=1 Tax=Nonomuraea rosea TaxID=638574 RepID=A0ABP6X129_9ACTN
MSLAEMREVLDSLTEKERQYVLAYFSGQNAAEFRKAVERARKVVRS